MSTHAMSWARLCCAARSGETAAPAAQNALRTSFQQDYDRLIFSSAFRRLQNKTQVFPLPGSVFVHNRLTHSLEVACVGRSLGKSAGELIAARYPDEGPAFTEFYKYDLASVIAAACLAHDIGNPPFGHSGEEAIRTFFRELSGERKAVFDTLSAEQQADFLQFEGNANAFRTLVHHFNESRAGGYRLTYATLAAIVKYPCSSARGFDKSTGHIATKKSGFFGPEHALYLDMAEAMQIPALGEGRYARHPFVYLTEAADDICYRVMDLEDAHRLRIISYETFAGLFLPFFCAPDGYLSRAYTEGKLEGIRDVGQKVQYIRARWIGLMTAKISEAFEANEAALLAGSLNTDLLHCLGDTERALLQAITEFSYQHVYNHRSVVEIELAGYHVIGGLLDAFTTAVMSPRSEKSRKLLQLLPPQFQAGEGDTYRSLLSVVDFIAGMTDVYAMELYRRITGISVQSLTI